MKPTHSTKVIDSEHAPALSCTLPAREPAPKQITDRAVIINAARDDTETRIISHSTLKTTFLLLFLTAALPSQQTIADVPKWLYLSAGVGWDNAEAIQLDSSNAEMSFDAGVFQPAIAFGVQTENNWRFELERVVHHNAPQILYSSSARIESDSDELDEFRSTSLMFNVLWDFRIGEALRPYVGAGLGWTKVHLHFSRPHIDEDPIFIPREDRFDDDDTSLALQFIAGFTVPVTRRFDIALDYRYWSAPSLKFEELSGADLDTQMDVHSAWFHVRYHAADRGPFRGERPRASHTSGWYVAAYAGGAFAEDSDVKGTENILDAFHFGPIGAVALGYALNDRWNFELAAGHQNNTIEVLELSGGIGEDEASGDLDMTTVTVNAIRHFAPESAIRPYIGVGTGMARGAYDVTARTFCRQFVCGTVEDRYEYVDDDATAFTVLAILGVEIAITPRLSCTADYHYWRTTGFELKSPTGETREINRQNSNSIMAGLRFKLQ